MGVCFIINHSLIKDGDVDMDPSSQTEFNPRKTNSAHSNFTWLRQIIFQPGQVFTGIVSEERKKNWLFPILVVSVLIICAALISTFLTTSTATPATSVRTTQSAQTTRTVTTNRGTGQNQGGQVPGGFVGGMPPGGEFLPEQYQALPRVEPPPQTPIPPHLLHRPISGCHCCGRWPASSSPGFWSAA